MPCNHNAGQYLFVTSSNILYPLVSKNLTSRTLKMYTQAVKAQWALAHLGSGITRSFLCEVVIRQAVKQVIFAVSPCGSGTTLLHPITIVYHIGLVKTLAAGSIQFKGINSSTTFIASNCLFACRSFNWYCRVPLCQLCSILLFMDMASTVL